MRLPVFKDFEAGKRRLDFRVLKSLGLLKLIPVRETPSDRTVAGAKKNGFE